ncbi:heterokaryon incompatibility protein-domain-containing protein, partial [Podospora appendiculata]
YQYEDLKGNDIRLVTLCPGAFNDDIVIRISHVPLSAPRDHGPKRMTLEEVAETLPPNWAVYEVFDGRYLFVLYSAASPNCYFLSSLSWAHPDASLAMCLYEKPSRGHVYHKHKYEALSYVWGSTDSKESVFVDPSRSANVLVSTSPQDQEVQTRSLGIGKNLASALRHLRHLDTERTLWIDAIAVNQDDHHEREQQVQRMADIYRFAHRVVVWLGVEGQASKLALSTLKHLANEIVTDFHGGYPFKSPTAVESDWSSHRNFALPYSQDIWQALDNLIRRDWFSRLWVWQEIKLAEEAIFHCGHDQIPRLAFHQAMLTLESQAVLPTDINRSQVLRTRSLLSPLKSSVNWPISITLWNTHVGMKCQDPRDYVYGVLGLLPARFRDRISLNYDIAVGKVYLDFVRAHIEHLQRLEMLTQSYLHGRSIDTPSWVPDFSALLSIRRQVSGQLAAEFSCSWVRFDEDQPSILETDGVQCAVVTSLSQPVPEFDDVKDRLKHTIRALEPDHSVMSGIYIIGEPFSVAYARTLCGNDLDERWPHYGFPTLERWLCQASSNALFGQSATALDGQDDTRLEKFERQYLSLLEGRSYMSTKEGYIGFAPKGATAGDVFCVLLGCDYPMLLRQQPNGSFVVVGECYVYGLNDGAGLLGPLPRNWRVQIFRESSGLCLELYRFYDAHTGMLTDEDPRLGPLGDWERIDHTRTGDDPVIFQFYKHKVTGETINSDPRMTPEALRARGVDVRTFRLV